MPAPWAGRSSCLSIPSPLLLPLAAACVGRFPCTTFPFPSVDMRKRDIRRLLGICNHSRLHPNPSPLWRFWPSNRDNSAPRRKRQGDPCTQLRKRVSDLWWKSSPHGPRIQSAYSQMPCTVRRNMGNRTPCHRAATATKPAMPKAIYGIDSPWCSPLFERCGMKILHYQVQVDSDCDGVSAQLPRPPFGEWRRPGREMSFGGGSWVFAGVDHQTKLPILQSRPNGHDRYFGIEWCEEGQGIDGTENHFLGSIEHAFSSPRYRTSEVSVLTILSKLGLFAHNRGTVTSFLQDHHETKSH